MNTNNSLKIYEYNFRAQQTKRTSQTAFILCKLDTTLNLITIVVKKLQIQN